MLHDSKKNYGSISIFLHWSSAVLILGLFGLGLYMTSLGYYDAWYHKGPWWHVSFGLVLFVLTLIRLIWRLCSQTPQHLRRDRISNSAATLVKWLLYITLLAVMVSGYLINTSKGQPASFFDWFGIPSIGSFTANTVDLLGEIHFWGAWLMMGLVVLHVGGALLHHFVWRDRTLVRMLKPTTDDALNK